MSKYRIKSVLDDGEVIWLIQKKNILFWSRVQWCTSKENALRYMDRRVQTDIEKKHFKSEVEYPQ